MLATAFPLCGSVTSTRHYTIFLRELEQLCIFCVGIVFVLYHRLLFDFT